MAAANPDPPRIVPGGASDSWVAVKASASKVAEEFRTYTK